MLIQSLILKFVEKFSTNLTNNLEKESRFKSRLIKTVFICLGLFPWIGIFVYAKYFMS